MRKKKKNDSAWIWAALAAIAVAAASQAPTIVNAVQSCGACGK